MLRAVTFISLLIVTLSIHAKNLHEPAACPSVKALYDAGLDFVRRDARHGSYWNGAIAKNKFDTTDEWSLTMGIFPGRHEAEAMHNGRAAISTLHLSYGPAELMGVKRHPGIWACWYEDSDSSVQAMALTPAQNVNG